MELEVRINKNSHADQCWWIKEISGWRLAYYLEREWCGTQVPKIIPHACFHATAICRIGHDFRFEMEMEKKYGCEVHAFDPRYCILPRTKSFNFVLYITYWIYCSVQERCGLQLIYVPGKPGTKFPQSTKAVIYGMGDNTTLLLVRNTCTRFPWASNSDENVPLVYW